LYTITQEYLGAYATLLAVGFSRWKLGLIVMIQSILLGSIGWTLGATGFHFIAQASLTTPVPLELTQAVWIGTTVFYFASCLIASFLSVRAIFRTDPGEVFRG
jgi:ABC-type antimicrobial peptide transport system permease subunit